MIFSKNNGATEKDFSIITSQIEQLGDTIKQKQEKKLTIIDYFQQKKSLYASKKISWIHFAFSRRKTRKTLKKLDEQIKSSLEKIKILGYHARKFVVKEEPKIIQYELASSAARRKLLKRKSKIKKNKKPKKAIKKIINKKSNKKSRKKK